MTTPDIDPALFRDAMSRLAASVNIITTEHDGTRRGCTATAVCSLSDTPASLIVCLNRGSSTGQLIQASGIVGVNLCDSADNDTAALFASKADDKFRPGMWDEGAVTGAPLLRSAVAGFEGRVVEAKAFGSHIIFIVEIVAVTVADQARAPLLYLNRAFGAFAAH